MNILEIILSVLFTALWLIPLMYELLIVTVRDNKNYHRKREIWDKNHPELQRRECKTCKYPIRETIFDGLYSKGFPHRHTKYCTLLRRKLRDNQCCLISEPPTEYFYTTRDTSVLYPTDKAEVYFSAYGDCYHSTPTCKTIKNTTNLYSSRLYLEERRPCPKCWIEWDGHLYPNPLHKD